MRGSDAPFFMALIVDGVELNVRWSEDQSKNPVDQKQAQQAKAAALVNDKPDFAAMKKAELVEYLAPNGNELDTTMTKAELLQLAERVFAQQK
jgi:hypothetical protein